MAEQDFRETKTDLLGLNSDGRIVACWKATGFSQELFEAIEMALAEEYTK